MKKRASFVAMYLCLLLLLTCGLGELLFVDKAARPSHTENRMLQGFPHLSLESIADGGFMDDFERYLSDGFFFREAAAQFSDTVLGLFSLPSEGPELGAIDQSQLFDTDREELDAMEELLQAGSASPEEAEPSAPVPTAESVLPQAQAVDASLWLIDSRGETVILETYPAEKLENLARILNEYRAELPEDGTLHFINPPISTVANNVIRGSYTDWGSDLEDALQPLVSEGVFIYDATDILRPYLFTERLYPINDHHGHPVSASLVADAMMTRQGIPPVDYASYRYTLSSGLGGPFDTATLAGMQIGVDDIPVMEPISPVESFVLTYLNTRTESVFINHRAEGYRQYLGGTMKPWRLFETGFHTGRNALVIGDSFTNSFLPFLVPYYDRILSTDYRDGNYLITESGANAAQYIEYYDIDDIYIVVCGYTPITGVTVQQRFEQYLYLDYEKVYG